jgi:hypothetical protein
LRPGRCTVIAIQNEEEKKMNVIKLRVGVFLAIIALLALAACGGGSDGAESEPTAPPASDDVPTAVATEVEEVVAPTEPPASSEGEEQPAPTEAPVEPTPESEVLYDIAVMEGATNLDIQENAMSYRLEQTQIEDVVEFYETRMVEQGWGALSSSTIGLMATLVYESDEGRVSVKLQANNFAETVDVTVLVFPK